MKKLILLPLLLLSISLFSQKDSKSGVFYKWFSPATTIDNLLGNPGVISSEFIFPDTTINIYKSNTLTKPTIHGIAIELDPFSDWFDTGSGSSSQWISENEYYFVDSIKIHGIYTRHLNQNIVDTLILQVRQNPSTIYSWDLNTSPWVMTNYGTDTLKFHPIFHKQGSPLFNDTNSITIKIPLTVADESNPNTIGSFFGTLPCGYFINPGSRVQIGISFKPGYSWTAHQDTLNMMNSFKFASYEENGDNNGMGTYPSYTKSDWGMSYILDSDNLYSSNPSSGFGSTYLPSYHYPQNFPFEHHWVDVLLSKGHMDWGSLPDTIYVPYSGGHGILGGTGFVDSIVFSDSSWIRTERYCGDNILIIDTNFSNQIRSAKMNLFNTNNASFYKEMICIQDGFVGINDHDASVQSMFYPNPTSEHSFLEFNLQKTEDVIISIYSINGQLIQIISKENLPIGKQKIEIQTSNLSSGVYFYKLQVGKELAFGKFIKQ